MPNKNWSMLKSLQLGRYAEYYAKMEFASYGFEIYSAEVDDHGVDFVIKRGTDYYDIQVKSLLKSKYIFMVKNKFPLTQNLLLCFILFKDSELPQIFLIPSVAWHNPNELLVDRDYEGLKSKAEYGLQISSKSIKILEKYSFDIIANKIVKNKLLIRCPKCSSVKIIPIIYGYPPYELALEEKQGKIKLGGCCSNDDSPNYHCRSCKNEWLSADKQS